MAMIPEKDEPMEDVIEKLKEGSAIGKGSSIIVVAEGDEAGNAYKIADKVKESVPELDTKVTMLGHIQRGGAPTAADRVLASRLGLGAVEALKNGKSNLMSGVINHKLVYTSLIDAIEKKKPVPVLKEGLAEQAAELIEKNMVSYYKIPVDYEIKGNFLGFIKFKRDVAKSKKSLNFDKETISVVQNDSTGAIIAQGELTIVGLPDEFF